MIARRVTVTGRVQGVGFRFFALRAAQELGVAGWVRNREDGSVESLAEGVSESVLRFVERLRTGPRDGLVREVRVDEVAVEGLQDFEIAR